MSDRLEQFESELAKMRPCAAGAEFTGRIETQLIREKRSDRMLIGAMSMGAIAACAIVTILIGQSSSPSQTSATVATTVQVPRIANDLQAFADISAMDSWK